MIPMATLIMHDCQTIRRQHGYQRPLQSKPPTPGNGREKPRRIRTEREFKEHLGWQESATGPVPSPYCSQCQRAEAKGASVFNRIDNLSGSIFPTRRTTGSQSPTGGRKESSFRWSRLWKVRRLGCSKASNSCRPGTREAAASPEKRSGAALLRIRHPAQTCARSPANSLPAAAIAATRRHCKTSKGDIKGPGERSRRGPCLVSRSGDHALLGASFHLASHAFSVPRLARSRPVRPWQEPGRQLPRPPRPSRWVRAPGSAQA